MPRNPSRVCPGQRGFSLIELMISVAIIAMATAIAIPMYGRTVDKSRRTALVGESRRLYTAMIGYHTDNGAFPSEAQFDKDTLEPLVREGYLRNPSKLLTKLTDKRVLLYLAPDVGGVDQQFIVVMRSAADANVIPVVVYTDIIGSTNGVIDGVYVITGGELQEAEEVN